MSVIVTAMNLTMNIVRQWKYWPCLSGTSPDGKLVEIIELPENNFFVACQFHPELVSRPNRPQPLFRDFIGST